MKDFLLVLFYQIIGAVEAAVIISGIIWLAKRKDEKDGRKPNPDFTPPPTKRKHDYFMQAETDGVVRRWANRGAAFPKDITVCGKQYMLWSINAEPDADVAEYREIKTPTTGTNVIEPKPKTDECCFNCVLFRWQKQKGGEQIFKPYCVVKQRPIEKDPWGGKCGNYVKESDEGMAARDYDDLNYKPHVREEFKKLMKVAPNEPCCENCAYLSTLGGDNICANTGLHVYAVGTKMHCFSYRPKANKRPAPLGTVTVGGRNRER